LLKSLQDFKNKSIGQAKRSKSNILKARLLLLVFDPCMLLNFSHAFKIFDFNSEALDCFPLGNHARAEPLIKGFALDQGLRPCMPCRILKAILKA